MVVNPAQQNLSAVASSEPQRAKRYLSTVYERLLAQPVVLDSPEGKQRAQQILILGNLVRRQYQVFAPELAAAADGFLIQLQRQLSPESESRSSSSSPQPAENNNSTKRLSKEELYENRLSELEDSAAKESNTLFRNVAYLRVALSTNPDDYDRATHIAQKIDDPDVRVEAISFVLYRAALFLVSKADVARAIEIAPKIAEPARQAVVKIAMAQRLISAKTADGEPGEATLAQQRALDLLNDLDRELKKGDPSANTARILLARTAILSKFDPDRALTSLEQTVQVINKLDRFDLRNGAAPSLGVTAVPNSAATVATPRTGFDFRSAIEALIDTDFERISAIAERLTAREQNGLARLEAAKLYLIRNRDSKVKESTAVAR